MENSTIYLRVKGMVTWSRLVRICPVQIIRVPSSVKSVQKVQSVQDQLWNKKEPKSANQLHFYYKLSNIQGFLNFGYIISIAIIGGICEALLFNLKQNSTQMVGFVANLFIFFIFPLAIISISNCNTPKVANNLIK